MLSKLNSKFRDLYNIVTVSENSAHEGEKVGDKSKNIRNKFAPD